MRKNIIFFRSLVFLAMTLLSGFAISGIAQEIASEAALVSNLTNINLPNRAERITDKNILPQFIVQLNQLFGRFGKTPRNVEVLGWDTDKGYTPQNAERFISDVIKSLEQNDYLCQLKEGGTDNGTSVKILSANRAARGDGRAVFGIFNISNNALFLAWANTFVIPDPPANAVQGKVLVQGEPSLTEGLVQTFSVAVQRDLGVPARATLDAMLRDVLTEIWRDEDEASINTIVSFLLRDEWASAKGADAELARLYLRNLLLQEAENQNSSRAAGLLKEMYETAHPALANGTNGVAPFRPDAQKAYVELISFALAELPDGINELSADERQWLADGALQNYKNGSAETQKLLVDLPFVWVALHNQWREMSEAERVKMRNKFSITYGEIAKQIKTYRQPKPAVQTVQTSQTTAVATTKTRREPYIPSQGYWNAIRDMRISVLNIGANIGGRYYWK